MNFFPKAPMIARQSEGNIGIEGPSASGAVRIKDDWRGAMTAPTELRGRIDRLFANFEKRRAAVVAEREGLERYADDGGSWIREADDEAESKSAARPVRRHAAVAVI